MCQCLLQLLGHHIQWWEHESEWVTVLHWKKGLRFWHHVVFKEENEIKLTRAMLELEPVRERWFPSACIKITMMHVLCQPWFYVIKGFWTIVFIFIVIFTTFHPIYPLALFRCLSNSELWITSFIESMEIACSDSISHNWVQMLSIAVVLLACSQDWTCNLQMIVFLEA